MNSVQIFFWKFFDLHSSCWGDVWIFRIVAEKSDGIEGRFVVNADIDGFVLCVVADGPGVFRTDFQQSPTATLFTVFDGNDCQAVGDWDDQANGRQ